MVSCWVRIAMDSQLRNRTPVCNCSCWEGYIIVGSNMTLFLESLQKISDKKCSSTGKRCTMDAKQKENPSR